MLTMPLRSKDGIFCLETPLRGCLEQVAIDADSSSRPASKGSPNGEDTSNCLGDTAGRKLDADILAANCKRLNGEEIQPKENNSVFNDQQRSANGNEESTVELSETERLLRLHSGCLGPWRLFASPLGGRGVVASRDILAGELVMRDPPLALAPRHSAVVCARCLRRGQQLRGCPRGCRLPVCWPQCPQQGDGSAGAGHDGECTLLCGWNVSGEGFDEKAWVPQLVPASAALRCLALPTQGRCLVETLQAHDHLRHGAEVDALLALLGGAPTALEQLFLRRACAVWDANAFEVSGAVRGLYPLAAMMNHCCSPNTERGYDGARAMLVRAAADIPRGAEVTASYAPLLWGTPARRRHLLLTKHFLCSCDRCADPKELNSFLSGLRCGRGGCEGAVVCTLPLDASSAWQCCQCGRRLSARQAGAVQAALGAMLAAVNTSDADAVANFLSGRRAAATLYPTNQVAVELKSCLVWLYGHHEKHLWTKLSTEQLSWKERTCRELLALLQSLRCQRMRLSGLLLLELIYTLEEKVRRCNDSQQGGTAQIASEISQRLHEASSIFDGDATAPAELWSRLADSRRTTS